MQGTYGLDILKYTETVKAVATASLPNEILRGLGYWFFYGGDRIGPWIAGASQYTQRPVVLIAGYGLAVACLLAGRARRAGGTGSSSSRCCSSAWSSRSARRRTRDPTPLGAVFKAFAEQLGGRARAAQHRAGGPARRARAHGAPRARAQRRGPLVVPAWLRRARLRADRRRDGADRREPARAVRRHLLRQQPRPPRERAHVLDAGGQVPRCARQLDARARGAGERLRGVLVG